MIRPDASVGPQVDFLVFDRPPESFDKDIVAPRSLAVLCGRRAEMPIITKVQIAQATSRAQQNGGDKQGHFSQNFAKSVAWFLGQVQTVNALTFKPDQSAGAGQGKEEETAGARQKRAKPGSNK